MTEHVCRICHEEHQPGAFCRPVKERVSKYAEECRQIARAAKRPPRVDVPETEEADRA